MTDRAVKLVLVFTVLLGMLIMMVSRAEAATYYVDATGGDDSSNDGLSEENAWKTVAKVNSSMASFANGDSVLFKRGETWATGTASCLQITKTGLTSYLTFGAYGTGDKPILSHDATGNGEAVIQAYTTDVDYIHIDNLDTRITAGVCAAISWGRTGTDHFWVSDCNVTSADNGIIVSYCDTFIIEDCNVSDTGNSGIGIMGTPTSPACNGIIRGCVVTNTSANDCITLHDDGSANPIGANFLLENNVCSGAHEDGFDITSGSNITIRDCETYGNTHSGIGTGAEDVLIERCYVHDELMIGILISGGTNRTTIANCLIEDIARFPLFVGSESTSTPNVYIYNITVYHTAAADPSLYITEYVDGFLFKNSVIVHTVGAYSTFAYYLNGSTYESTGCDFDSNLWWQTGRAEYSLGTNSVWGDPDFTNAGGGDFTLTAPSPAIDSGGVLSYLYDDGIDPTSGWPTATATTLDQDSHGTAWERGCFIYPNSNGTPSVYYMMIRNP